MGWLTKGPGEFSLDNSDHQVGSLFTISDIMEILDIPNENGNNFITTLKKWNLLATSNLVDERDLYNHYKDLKNTYSHNKIKGKSSLDEYILLTIFKRTFPAAKIEQQVKISGATIDFKITYNNQTKFVEFDGPSHFISQYGKDLENPFIRVDIIQQETGCELIRWPYWIQRCSQNAKILFDTSLKGYGALWTSKAYFNAFTIPQPSETIRKLTRRFNAEDENGIGYFYEQKSVNRIQPEHKLIKKAQKDPHNLTRFMPIDAREYKYWLPVSLWDLYEKQYSDVHTQYFNNTIL